MINTSNLTIVLVNYNSGVWLERCLASFRNIIGWNEQEPPYRVILVDNASSDGSTELVERAYDWLEVIRLPENVGFSAGNNVALSQVTTPFAMLLNTDTEFIPGTDLSVFIEQNFSDPNVGVLSPRVEFPDGTLDHASHRGFPTLWNAAAYFSGLSRAFPRSKIFAGYTLGWKNPTEAHEIQACTGAAMIVRTSAMQEVGLLDESFFMYAEDIDWCKRFFDAGWKIWYDPSLVVIHHKHKSGQGKDADFSTKERTIRAFYDTMKQYFRKHSSQSPALVLLGAFAMIDILKYRKLNQERKRHVRSRTSIQN